jgi:hypothetical protein
MTNPFGEARNAGSGRSYLTMATGDTMHIIGASKDSGERNMNLEKTSMGFNQDYMNAANASRTDRAIDLQFGWYWDNSGNLRIGSRNDARDIVRKPDADPKAVRALIDRAA